MAFETVSPPVARPAAGLERILDLDILRGVALFGILAANMRGFSAPLDVYFDIGKWYPGRADQIAQFFIDVFVQRKFVTLFAFMFGVGFAAQMTRNEARGARLMSFYPRRLAALALFGLIHGIAIWAGDILLTYAIAGTMLLFLRNRSQGSGLRWAFGTMIASTLVMTGFTLATAMGLRKQTPPEAFDRAKVAHAVQVYSHGTLSQILHQNWLEWVHDLRSQAFSFFSLALFLLGLWVYRAGILEHLAEYRPVFLRVCRIALPVGLLLNLVSASLVYLYPASTPGRLRPLGAGWAINVLSIWAGPILSAGYASGLAVLLQDPTWRKRFTPFAAVGRTALTNYLAQSVICFWFFRLTHLHGVWGPAWDLLPTVVLFSIQILISNWWLQRYRFGPMEWVWRGLTYGRWPEMRRIEPGAA